MSAPLSGDSPSQTNNFSQYLDSVIGPTSKTGMCGCNIFTPPSKSAGLQHLKEFVSCFLVQRSCLCFFFFFFGEDLYKRNEIEEKKHEMKAGILSCLGKHMPRYMT